RPGIDTSAAAGLNGVRSSLFENIQIAFANAVVARLLRSELNKELHRVGHALALLHCICQHPRIHIHVFVFARSTRAAVCQLNRNWSIQLANILPVSWI